ncbi:nitrilase-related carbon-nitrogen hydrolase [Pseudalkalibacillus decolorationis]|uniref:nitrilase-related carbon-nitrogen hydrolase n=1 Tax=Pseudalkalibacillus decolorationis TaxID=163879 RepID=UPI002147E7C4|nr:nitrilase-related carbon-nitrogen hydrolase [Pseudalkalibacillus decolorationis]
MLKVAAIQLQAFPGQRDKNIRNCIEMVEKAAEQGAELIVLPELWVSGYYLTKDEFQSLQEVPTGETVSLFQKLAKKLGVMLIVPYVEGENEHLYISLAVIETTGEVLANYRKSFLWGREKEIFTPGERVYNAIDTSKGKIGVLICADIEFPEPSRILALQGVELIIVPSVWSYGAETRWDIQLPARALDNSVYILGVNTVNEGSCGKSKLVAPNGEVLCEASRSEQSILIHDVDFSIIPDVRKEVPYLKDLDKKLLPNAAFFETTK